MPNEISDTTKACLNTAPNYLEGMADALAGPERGELAGELDALVQNAIYRWAYIDHRYGNGCGDQGHDDSEAHARKMLKRIRAQMGDTFP